MSCKPLEVKSICLVTKKSVVLYISHLATPKSLGYNWNSKKRWDIPESSYMFRCERAGLQDSSSILWYASRRKLSCFESFQGEHPVVLQCSGPALRSSPCWRTLSRGWTCIVPTWVFSHFRRGGPATTAETYRRPSGWFSCGFPLANAMRSSCGTRSLKPLLSRRAVARGKLLQTRQGVGVQKNIAMMWKKCWEVGMTHQKIPADVYKKVQLEQWKIDTGCLWYTGDYTAQLYGDHKKPF